MGRRDPHYLPHIIGTHIPQLPSLPQGNISRGRCSASGNASVTVSSSSSDSTQPRSESHCRTQSQAQPIGAIAIATGAQGDEAGRFGNDVDIIARWCSRRRGHWRAVPHELDDDPRQEPAGRAAGMLRDTPVVDATAAAESLSCVPLSLEYGGAVTACKNTPNRRRTTLFVERRHACKRADLGRASCTAQLTSSRAAVPSI